VRARELKTTDKGFRRRRIRESPPAPHPTVLATMLPPRSFCQDLVRGKQRRAPRAREPRNFRGAERPSFQLSLKRGGSRRHVCPPVLASREIHLPTRWREGGQGRGEPPAQETRVGVRWPPREKTDRPCQRRFHWHRSYGSNQTRVAAAPIRGPEKASCRFYSACRGPKFPELKGWGATLLSRG
jgi:hypothetical protein